MTRKRSETTKEHIISVGLGLAKAGGLKGFSLRRLCKEADVNLGVFHYYFKTKDNFNEYMLKKLYGELMAPLNAECARGKGSQNIETILSAIRVFARANRVVLSSLLGEALMGNKKIITFLARNCTVHVRLLYDYVEQAKKRGYIKTSAPTPVILFNLIFPLVIPQIIIGTSERLKMKEFTAFASFIDTPQNNDGAFKMTKTFIKFLHGGKNEK